MFEWCTGSTLRAMVDAGARFECDDSLTTEQIDRRFKSLIARLTDVLGRKPVPRQGPGSLPGSIEN